MSACITLVGSRAPSSSSPSRPEVAPLGADALKVITVAVYERREEIPDLEMVGLVHDEVILLVPEERAEIFNWFGRRSIGV